MKMNIKNLLNACAGTGNDTVVIIHRVGFELWWMGKLEMLPKKFENKDVVQFSVYRNTIDVFIK